MKKALVAIAIVTGAVAIKLDSKVPDALLVKKMEKAAVDQE